MALVNAGEIPRGLDVLGIKVITGGTPGSLIDVPGPRGLSFNVVSDSDKLEGGNAVIAIARDAKSVEGSVELGKMNLTSLGGFTGNSATTAGSTPNQITSVEEDSQAPTVYCQILGQSYSRDATDSAYRVTIYNALITSGPDEQLQTGEWSTPTLDFEGSENASGKLLKRQNFETWAALS